MIYPSALWSVESFGEGANPIKEQPSRISNRQETHSMSTFSSNESRFGSTWLQFLKRPRSHKEAAPTAAEGSQPFLSLVESVRTWAEESPNATAVTTARETLSYAQLEAQSNALARHLESLGAAPETLVALVLDRSPEFAIAALATWKAGAAYLPIDPACPAERMRLILDDARAPILIRSGLLPNRTVPGIRKTGRHFGPPFPTARLFLGPASCFKSIARPCLCDLHLGLNGPP